MNIEAAIAARNEFRIGEVAIRFEGPLGIISGPRMGSTGPARVASDDLRELVRTDDHGRYRPLPGARTLPGGWEVRCHSADELLDAIDAIYPLALRHIGQHERGELRVIPLDEVLRRQSGRYAVAASLGVEGRKAACNTLCGRCVRTPVWCEAALPPGGIPCPEPCSVLVSLCREAAVWETSPPAPSAPVAGLPFARFDIPGNEVRETYLAERAGAPLAGSPCLNATALPGDDALVG